MTIIYQVSIKKHHVKDFEQLARDILVPQAEATPGCIRFDLNQNISDKKEFIFYEIWKDAESVKLYKLSLANVLGQPREGDEFPEAMNQLIESDKDIYISE